MIMMGLGLTGKLPFECAQPRPAPAPGKGAFFGAVAAHAAFPSLPPPPLTRPVLSPPSPCPSVRRQHRRAPRPRPRRAGPQDVQVPRERGRPAGRRRAAGDRRAALHPRDGHGAWDGPEPVPRAPRGEPQPGEQVLERREAHPPEPREGALRGALRARRRPVPRRGEPRAPAARRAVDREQGARGGGPRDGLQREVRLRGGRARALRPLLGRVRGLVPRGVQDAPLRCACAWRGASLLRTLPPSRPARAVSPLPQLSIPLSCLRLRTHAPLHARPSRTPASQGRTRRRRG